MIKNLLLVCFVISLFAAQAQIVINEASNRNGALFTDEDGDYEDWFELYNAGASAVNLNGYTISDDSLELDKWMFPSIILNPSNHLLVYASGKNRFPDFTTDHYEFPVNEGVDWKYIVPGASTPSYWMNTGFDDSAWNTGKASIGYGDSDDSSVVDAGTMSVYMRYAFSVADTSLINDAVLHVDFDDGFVAYLNGNVIAAYGFSDIPDYNDASGLDHEASLYAGYAPVQFEIDEATLHAYMQEGTNVLAVEVHNTAPGSSDLTANAFLSFAVATSDILWSMDYPYWYSSYYSGTNLHTNFKINTEGEMLFLLDASGDLIDEVLVDDLDTDFSIGRKTDGNDTLQIFAAPTPGYSNNTSTSYTGYVASPTFSMDAGFYESTISTAIIIPAGDVSVYYTTDGEIPTTSDILYTGGPIDISSTTVIKARCFDNTGVLLPGKVTTNTYFINEEITVPVLSITTDEVNLYGSTGIYDNWWTDWKKPCYIEYFDSLHINAFEQNAGIKIDGGAGGSRSNAQKSFRVEPDNSAYGDGVLNYSIIPRLWYVDEYETFYLRNGSNMSNVLPYKDAFMTRITDGTLNEHMAYTPIVVFLNGEYWGLYELRDKLDAPHFDHAHKVENDELDLLSLSYWYGSVMRTLSGSDTDFYFMRDFLYYYPSPSDTDFFSIADTYIDVHQFTDYLIAETYFGNADWPWNNIKIFRDRGGNNKWQYGLIDVEWGLGYAAWTNAYTDMISYLFDNNSNIEAFYALNQNEKFRHYFVNRYADLMNTTFLPDRMLAIEDTIYAQVEDELPRQWIRWWTSDMPYAYSVFNDYRFGLLDDLNIRTNLVRNHIENNYDLDDQVELTLDVYPPGAGKIKISTLTIHDLPWSGVYFDGVPVTITAVANTGFTFNHWAENDFIDDTLNATFTNNFTSDQLFTAYFTGSAASEDITVSEINYQNEASVDAGDWFEIWNYGTAAVNLSNWQVKDGSPLNNFKLPEGTILNPDERIVFVSDTSLFQQQHPGVTNYLGPVDFSLDNNFEKIKIYNDKNELKLEMQYADSLPWPVGANGEGRTLELINPAVDLNNPDNWFDGCIGGSPGTAYSPCNDAIIISEINYHANDTADSQDWIELRNISDASTDVGGWKLKHDGTEEFIIPSPTVLAPHTNFVLAQNDYTFNLIYPDVTDYAGSFVFNFDNGGDWIALYDASGVLINSVHYSDDAPWQTAADGEGYTLEIVDSLGKMNEAENWTIVCPQGSPAAYAVVACADTIVSVADENINLQISVQPNPATDFTVLQCKNMQAENMKIELTDVNGAVLQTVFEGKYISDTYYIHTKHLAAGVYFVSVQTEQQKSVIKLVKE